MDSLLPLLSQLGPWGMAAAFLILWFRSRQPGPGPTPTPTPSGTPILDAVLNLLRQRFAQHNADKPGSPARADLSVEEAAELLARLSKK